MLQSLECRGDPEAAQAASQHPQAGSLPVDSLTASVMCPSHYDAHPPDTPLVSEGGQAASGHHDTSESAQRSEGAGRALAPLVSVTRSAVQAKHAGSVTERNAEGARPLSWDSCQQITALAAYPISAWV